MIVKNNEKLKSKGEKGDNVSGRCVGKGEKGNQWPSNKMEDLFLWRIVGIEKFPVLAWVTDFQE